MKFATLLLASGLILLHGSYTQAATPRGESFLDEPVQSPVIELRPGPVAPAPPDRANTAGTVSGNPLWSMPLSALSGTRERPIFSPSRRPIPAAVVSVPPRQPPRPPPPPPPVVIERLVLNLVGTVANGSEGVAIFVDPATRETIRLRVGEAHFGWVLRSISGREAFLEKGDQTETLTMPRPDQFVQPTPLPTDL